MKNEASVHRVQFGPYEADFRTQEIWKNQIRLKLARQPFEILAMLVANAGELVAREDLERRLWPEGHFIDAAHGLNAAVNKLRETLCDSADRPKYIETLPRRGYRFIGEVAEVSGETQSSDATQRNVQGLATPAPSIATEITAPSSASEMTPLATKGAIHRHWRVLATVGLALTAGSLIGFVLTDHVRSNYDPFEPAKKTAEQQESVEKFAPADSKSDAARPHPATLEHRSTAKSLPDSLPHREGYGALQMAEFRTIIPGDAGNAAPQFSPDGKRIIFMSNRSGPWQIWMSNADGSDPVQVTFTDSAGTPRWSPDGKSIAFDAPLDDGTHIFVAPIDQPSVARPVAEGCVPSFSRDGKFVYFSSDRTGDWQIWKAPVSGGSAIQVTRYGGFAALESADGNVYYSKSRGENPEIWKVPVSGGDESLVTASVKPRTWRSWTVANGGLLLFSDTPDGKTFLDFYDPANYTTRALAPLHTAAYWMGATSDGKKVVMNDAAERQITMLDHLR
jgi:DNA-binding winged helix-turn-helix (wHTH) protein